MEEKKKQLRVTSPPTLEARLLRGELQNLIPLKVKLENPKGSPLATFHSHCIFHFPFTLQISLTSTTQPFLFHSTSAAWIAYAIAATQAYSLASFPQHNTTSSFREVFIYFTLGKELLHHEPHCHRLSSPFSPIKITSPPFKSASASNLRFSTEQTSNPRVPNSSAASSVSPWQNLRIHGSNRFFSCFSVLHLDQIQISRRLRIQLKPSAITCSAKVFGN
ncbi:hypothetical protein LR48_Vigan06g151700 [Vigna angularis]|uniref:Uncharacterized protein n=1 Tax=Phaseolus angularis TaxID=3914 RepID=A0A0L9UU03_PHAAN|nr:hypothetical protein LR48_Vigan06g151700 [Vigna angularis]